MLDERVEDTPNIKVNEEKFNEENIFRGADIVFEDNENKIKV
jgi:hypothetical protein